MITSLAMLAIALVAGFVTVTLDQGLTFYSLGKDNSKPSAFNAAPAGVTVATIGDAAALGQRAEKGYQPTTIEWFVLFPGAAPASQSTNLEGCNGDPTNPNEWFILDTYALVANNANRILVNALPKFVRCNCTSIVTPGGGLIAGIYVG